MSEPNKTGQLERCMKVNSVRSLNEETRTCELSFSSEEPYGRWFGTEILEHTEAAVNLDRINEIGCLLYNHKRDFVIGKIVRAWLEDGKGKAEVQFDEDEESEKIYKKVLSGTLKGVSVGYQVETWEEVTANKKSTDGRFVGPVSIAKRWFPFEISIVSIPADATVGVGRQFENTEASGSLTLCERQLQINKNLLGGNQSNV